MPAANSGVNAGAKVDPEMTPVLPGHISAELFFEECRVQKLFWYVVRGVFVSRKLTYPYLRQHA